jgi:hypothetical protein
LAVVAATQVALKDILFKRVFLGGQYIMMKVPAIKHFITTVWLAG